MSPGQRSNPWPWIVGLLALLLAGWIWHWAATNFERRTETVQIGWSDEARRNPYLAAEQFLDRLGLDARSIAGRGPLRALPPAGDTLIVPGLGPLSRQRRAVLLDWLEQGGRLVVEAMVVTPPGSEPRADSLLADVGAVLREHEPDVSPDDDRPAEAIAHLALEADGARPIEVAFLARYFLEDRDGEADGRIEAAGKARLLRYDIGDGALIVLSDTAFMTNDDIGAHDHAWFTALLADGSQTVWIIHDSSMPGLPALLWDAAPQAMIAAAVLLLLLLWHPGGRLGPLLPPPARARRDLLLHLDAAADLLWRHGRGGLQLAATRRRIEQAWLRRHPALRALSSSERSHWLAERNGLDPADIELALYRHVGVLAAEDVLIQASRTLQQLRLQTRVPGRAT